MARKPVFGIADRSDTNRAKQPQMMVRGLKFQIVMRDCSTYVVKTKALISCAVTAKLICVFVFASINAKSRFSPVTAQICLIFDWERSVSQC